MYMIKVECIAQGIGWLINDQASYALCTIEIGPIHDANVFDLDQVAELLAELPDSMTLIAVVEESLSSKIA